MSSGRRSGNGSGAGGGAKGGAWLLCQQPACGWLGGGAQREMGGVVANLKSLATAPWEPFA